MHFTNNKSKFPYPGPCYNVSSLPYIDNFTNIATNNYFVL